MPQLTIATTGIRILRRNPQRKSFSFQHVGTANNIFLDTVQPTAISSTTASLRLVAGQAFVANVIDDGEEQVQDEWSAIADAGSQTLLVFETFAKEEKEFTIKKLIQLARQEG